VLGSDTHFSGRGEAFHHARTAQGVNLGLTHEDVLEILRAIDSSACQELILETPDLRLVVRKVAAGATQLDAAGTQFGTAGLQDGEAQAATPGTQATPEKASKVSSVSSVSGPALAGSGEEPSGASRSPGGPEFAASPTIARGERVEVGLPQEKAARAAPPAGAVPVRAPMIGRFYRSPEPGAPPFVEIGSAVQPDDTVGLIEVMKLLTPVKAGVKGRVVAIWAEDGQMVEFGEELMWIVPET